jgi:hypothetical protein
LTFKARPHIDTLGEPISEQTAQDSIWQDKTVSRTVADDMQKCSRWLWLSVGVALVLVCGIWQRKKSTQPFPSRAQAGSGVAQSVTPASGDNLLYAKLRTAVGAMRSSSTNAAAEFAELRAALASTARNECIQNIVRLLDSGEDARTGQGFRVGKDGVLEEAPTLRVWLLDYLSRLDPALAAEYAKKVLTRMQSADEWAVALRCVAVVDVGVEGRSFLESKTAELLTNEEWQQKPSSGYLEAFDVAVHLGGTNLIPPLGNLVRKLDNQAVAHAAYLTLDRLTLSDPVGTLSLLANDPELMRGREETRANYFARADVRDPAQRRLLETYLLRPALDPTELARFSGVYPNANYMVSHNLLTKATTPDAGWLRSRDAEALKVAGEWLADSRFQQLKPQLERIRERLNKFVQN